MNLAQNVMAMIDRCHRRGCFRPRERDELHKEKAIFDLEFLHCPHQSGKKKKFLKILAFHFIFAIGGAQNRVRIPQRRHRAKSGGQICSGILVAFSDAKLIFFPLSYRFNPAAAGI